MNLTRREVKGRYSQSLFGAGWAIAQPLATMAVFTLVFARLGKMPSGGAPYPLFAFAALVPWFFFSNSVMSGTMSLVTYRNIVTKTYFPREIVPLAQVGSRLVDHHRRVRPLRRADDLLPASASTPWAALVPVFLVLLLLFTVGVTLAPRRSTCSIATSIRWCRSACSSGCISRRWRIRCRPCPNAIAPSFCSTR